MTRLTLRDHAFDVTGGRIPRAQQRWGYPRERRYWRIVVRPVDSSTDAVIVLPGNVDCETLGAVCTSDGRKLQAGVTVTVGP